MKSQTSKMAEHSRIPVVDPIIISGKSKSGVLAGRWQMLCYKVLSYQHRPMSGTPKQPNEAVQTTFQSTKYVGGPSSQACLTDIEKIQEFQVFGLLDGWVKMSSKETSPGHLLNNTRANQTSKWTNTYPTNDNQSHLGGFQTYPANIEKSEFFTFWSHCICVYTQIHFVYTYLCVYVFAYFAANCVVGGSPSNILRICWARRPCLRRSAAVIALRRSGRRQNVFGVVFVFLYLRLRVFVCSIRYSLQKKVEKMCYNKNRHHHHRH